MYFDLLQRLILFYIESISGCKVCLTLSRENFKAQTYLYLISRVEGSITRRGEARGREGDVKYPEDEMDG